MRRISQLSFALAMCLGPVLAEARAEDDLWGGVRHFAADLSADNQVTVTNSNATGAVDIVFDIETKLMTWEITYQNLTSRAVGVNLHGPAQPGTNGAALIDLAQGKPNSPIRGTGPVTAAQVQYLLLGWTYVSIATERYPDGEIRGKVDVVPPAAYKRFDPETLTKADAQ